MAQFCDVSLVKISQMLGTSSICDLLIELAAVVSKPPGKVLSILYSHTSVSYTHLDVYKRQVMYSIFDLYHRVHRLIPHMLSRQLLQQKVDVYKRKAIANFYLLYQMLSQSQRKLLIKVHFKATYQSFRNGSLKTYPDDTVVNVEILSAFLDIKAIPYSCLLYTSRCV